MLAFAANTMRPNSQSDSIVFPPFWCMCLCKNVYIKRSASGSKNVCACACTCFCYLLGTFSVINTDLIETSGSQGDKKISPNVAKLHLWHPSWVKSDDSGSVRVEGRVRSYTKGNQCKVLTRIARLICVCMHVCMCASEANSSDVITFRFSVKMPCVVVQWELS